MKFKCALFAGPSLSITTVLPDFIDVYPPIKSGDIYRLLNKEYALFAILDGLFHGVASIWHREITSAIDEGIAVWGASSMGALRSSELHQYGMQGFGQVFEWYFKDQIDGDDEVALLHSPNPPYSSLTIPLVDIRYCLLIDYGLSLSNYEHKLVIKAARSIPYWERTDLALSKYMLKNGFEFNYVSNLISSLNSRQSVKKIDADLLITDLCILQKGAIYENKVLLGNNFKQLSAINLYKQISFDFRKTIKSQDLESYSSPNLSSESIFDSTGNAFLNSFFGFWFEDKDPQSINNELYKDIFASSVPVKLLDYSRHHSNCVLTKSEIYCFYYISSYFYRLKSIWLDKIGSEFQNLANIYMNSNECLAPSFPVIPVDEFNILDNKSCIAFEIFVTAQIFRAYALDRLHLKRLYRTHIDISKMLLLPDLLQDYVLAKTFGIGPLGCSWEAQQTHNLKYIEYCILIHEFVI